MEKNIFNYKSINQARYSYIKNRIGDKSTLLLTNIEKNFPNSEIYLFGSVIDFTFIKEISDVDCKIVFSDENEKNKIINYIINQHDITHINHLFFDIIHNNKIYKQDVIKCFVDGQQVDISLIDNETFFITKKKLALKTFFSKCSVYILKMLYIKKKIINKHTFQFLRQSSILYGYGKEFKTICRKKILIR